MAKKKIAAKKKVAPKATHENRDGEKLNAKEVKRFQEMIARIGAQKSRGVIYMIEMKKDELCDGVLFAHNMSKANIAGNLLNQLKLDPLTMLALSMPTLGGKDDK